MSWFGGPDPGDWVVSTRFVKATWTDHLLGGDAGIKRGTRGVVLARHSWGGVEVRFDCGLSGPLIVRTSTNSVRIVRRKGGVAAFDRRSSRVTAARLGVAIALIAPFALFTARWFLQGGSRDGLVIAVAEGLVYGAFDLVEAAFAHPGQTLLYVGVLWLAGRFAFGSR